MEIWVLLGIAYWTFAVACVAILASTVDDISVVIGASALWPVVAVIMLFALPYQATVASAKRIRADLRNRKLLREFNEWLKEKEQGAILPKNKQQGESRE